MQEVINDLGQFGLWRRGARCTSLQVVPITEKQKWVKKHYVLDMTHVQWISAYRDESLPLHFHKDTVVLQGIEAWIKRDVSKQEGAAVIRLKWQENLREWRIWEEAKKIDDVSLSGQILQRGLFR